MSRLLRSPHVTGDCFSGSDKIGMCKIVLCRVIRSNMRHETQKKPEYFLQMRKTPPRVANRSDQFTHMSVHRKHCVLQHVTQCFSSCLLCSCVPISSTVQVEALGVVSMDTKQLAGIQNRTWRVAYLQALGARKSQDDRVS